MSTGPPTPRDGHPGARQPGRSQWFGGVFGGAAEEAAAWAAPDVVSPNHLKTPKSPAGPQTPSKKLPINSMVAPRPTKPPHPGWFVRNVDYGYYKQAQKTLRETKGKISQLRFGLDDLDYIRGPPMSTEVALDRLDDTLDDLANPRSRNGRRPKSRGPEEPARNKRSAAYALKYRDAVSLVSDIVGLFTPTLKDFQYPLGLLMVSIRAVANRREREDIFMDELERFISCLSVCTEYLNLTKPNGKCKRAMCTVYTRMLDYLEALLLHARPSKSSKLLGVIFQSHDDALAQLLESLDTAMDRLKAEVILSPKEISPKETNTVIGQMVAAFEAATVSITASLETIDTRVVALENQQNAMHKFTMTKHSQELQAAVMASPLDTYWPPSESFDRVKKFQPPMFEPSQGWEGNGVLGNLEDWRDAERMPGIWVGGAIGNKDSWVSCFSIDVISALAVADVPCFYILSSDLSAMGLPVTATRVLRNLICQILESKPEVAFENPEFFTVEKAHTATVFPTIWNLFEELMRNIPSDFFIVIDRVDNIQPDPVSTMETEFIPRLLETLSDIPGALVIFTSMYEPPPRVQAFAQSSQLLDMVYIDSTLMQQMPLRITG